jgi:protease-4
MKKFLLGILAGAIIAGVSGVVLFFAAVRAARSRPDIPAQAVLELRLEGAIPEGLPAAAPLPALESRTPPAVVEIWRSLRRAAGDPKVRAVWLRPRGLSAGWAKIEELRAAVAAFRQSRKPVYAWLESPGMKEYYLASAADRIILSPEDLLDVKGLRLEALYLKGTLDKLGVQVDIEHAGRYKDAGDVFTRSGMSPETRESLNAVLDGLFERWISAVAAARGMAPAALRGLIDEGPFLAPAALKRRLVDELAHERAALDALRQKAGAVQAPVISLRRYAETGGRARRARVALLVAQGDIVRGSLAGVLGDEIGISPDSIGRQARLIAADPGIRGVILRIDSPGGDAIASDEILEILKRLSQAKPLVISMSDLAASGGYYIAMTGDPIVAHAGTLTGSIGVVYGKVNLAGLYAKLGLSKEILKRGRFADIDSDVQPLTPEARKKLRESIDFIYDGFLRRVADGRKRRREEVAPYAEGRVWLGQDAREKGLIDETGGLDKAIELLRRRAAIQDGQEIQLVVFPGRRTVWSQLFDRRDEAVLASPAQSLLRELGPGAAPWLRGGMLRIMPYRLEIR